MLIFLSNLYLKSTKVLLTWNNINLCLFQSILNSFKKLNSLFHPLFWNSNHFLSKSIHFHPKKCLIWSSVPHLKTFKDVLAQVFRFYRNSPVMMAALHEIQVCIIHKYQTCYNTYNMLKWLLSAQHNKDIYELNILLINILFFQAVFDDPIIKPQQAKDVRRLSHECHKNPS